MSAAKRSGARQKRELENGVLEKDKKLLVIASEWDEAARTLVERWAAFNACLITPSDLSMEGWRYLPGDLYNSVALASGSAVPVSEIQGVVTRLPWVYEHDLRHIIPSDRTYVAAEMSAFLVAWLTELPCKVLNRPTPVCLSGPFWRHEKWVHMAAQLGIPVSPAHRTAPIALSTTSGFAPLSGGNTITLVGQKHLGSAHPDLIEQARALALAADVELLAVSFSGPESDSTFVSATPWVDLADPLVADAVLSHILSDTGETLTS